MRKVGVGKPRIAVAADYLYRSAKTGIEIYATEVLKRIVKDTSLEWTFLVSGKIRANGNAHIVGVKERIISNSLLLNYAAVIPCMTTPQHCDTLFIPSQYMQLWKSTPTVVCAFDVAWRYYPEYFPRGKRLAFELMTRRIVSKADAILCISKSTIRDLRTLYECPEEKLVLAYPGVDAVAFSPRDDESDDAVLAKHDIHVPYILHLGTLQRRKNLDALITAFERMKRKDVQLVLAGGKGWFYESIVKRVESSPRKTDIRISGFVDEGEKPALLRKSALLTCLSLYEGFGIPVLEAMACGTPVLVANASSLPEIVENELYIVDPSDIGTTSERMEFLLSSGRNTFATYLEARARRFSWDSTAATALAVLRKHATP
jgi:glycosyltransferase involved in cell wall biosynthesis